MKKPQIHAAAYVAPGAVVLGDVTLCEGSSVLFNAVVRSEHDVITIGARSNIQDNCTLHTDGGFPLTLGEGCTVGHGAILHGCTIGDNTLIGMGSIVMNGAVIGKNCVVGAGALVTQGTVIPDGSLVLGSPAKVRREVTEEEIAANRRSAAHYVAEAAAYRAYFEK